MHIIDSFFFFALNSVQLSHKISRIIRKVRPSHGYGTLFSLLRFSCCSCAATVAVVVNLFRWMADVNKYCNHSCLQLFMPVRTFIASQLDGCRCIPLPQLYKPIYLFQVIMHFFLSILYLQIIDNKLECKIEDSWVHNGNRFNGKIKIETTKSTKQLPMHCIAFCTRIDTVAFTWSRKRRNETISWVSNQARGCQRLRKNQIVIVRTSE